MFISVFTSRGASYRIAWACKGCNNKNIAASQCTVHSVGYRWSKLQQLWDVEQLCGVLVSLSLSLSLSLCLCV